MTQKGRLEKVVKQLDRNTGNCLAVVYHDDGLYWQKTDAGKLYLTREEYEELQETCTVLLVVYGDLKNTDERIGTL